MLRCDQLSKRDRALAVVFALATIGAAGCGGSGGVNVSPPAPAQSSIAPLPGVPVPECTSVKVAPVSAGTVYTVPSGASGLAAECQIQAEYLAGAVVVAYTADMHLVAQSFGETPDTQDDTITTVSNTSFPPSPLPSGTGPYANPGPSIVVASATPGTAASQSVGLEAIVRGSGGVPVTFTATAASPADLQAELSAWISTSSVFTSATPPPPPSRAWSLIGEYQSFTEPFVPNWYQSETKTVGSVGVDTKVWRLSTNDPASDYVMAVATVSSTPKYLKGFGNSCGINCGYFTWARNQTLSMMCGPDERDVASTTDVGPLNQVQVNKVTWSVGGTLSGKIGYTGDKGASVEGNAGLNVGYSQSWDQMLASTVLTSSVGAPEATWQDLTSNFMSGSTWDFGAHNITTTVANYTNGKVAIFKCPRGPVVRPSVNAPVLYRAAALYAFVVSFDEKQINSARAWDLTMPTFDVDTASLTISPGSSKRFRIKVKSSPLEAPKAWVVVPDPNDSKLLITPSTGTDSTDGSGALYQTIDVFAQTSAVPGNRYTLYVNTVPAGGADKLRNGSLKLSVSIVP